MIRTIQQSVARGKAARSLVLPIGDDAAAFRPRSGRLVLVSCDALVEGVHFDLTYCSPEDLGWKALAVNLSDIAAMGGTARYVLTSIALPRGLRADFVPRLYRGLAALAKQRGVTLVGGDTCASLRHLFIDVAIVGDVEPAKMLTRKGAKPGDALFVTGELGGAALGLEQLRRSPKSRHSKLARRHLRPQPRCTAGRFLAANGLASAMIDSSDGLSTDLHHLCEESGVGALVLAERIPLPRLALATASPSRALECALNGGEDYELLFTVPPNRKSRVPRDIDGVVISEIGTITAERGCWISTPTGKKKLGPEGYDHFRQG